MKKFILVILSYVLIITTTFSQESLQLDYVNYNNVYIVKPTLNNLLELIFASEATYRNTLKSYRYTLESDGAYYAGTPAGGRHYTVEKTSSEIIMYSQKDEDFIYSIRKEISDKLGAIRPTFNGGFECYSASTTYGNINYKIEIRFKSTSTGGSVIRLILR